MNIFIGVLVMLILFCMGYYAFAVSYAGAASSFLWFWLLAAMGFAGLLVIAFLHKKFHILDTIPRIIKIVVVTVFCLGCVLFLSVEGLIISKMCSKAKPGVDYVIVLGAQVRGERVTKSLAKRLDAAYEYLMKNENTLVVCTGGQGSGENISEALAMKRYLMDKGIDENRIIMEDKSASTYENLKFTLDIIGDKGASIAIVTNNFHVYRSMYLGKHVGFRDVQGIAGTSDNRLLLNYMVREGIALFKELIIH